MKQYKQDVVNQIIKIATGECAHSGARPFAGERCVYLKEAAQAVGVKRLSRVEVNDIMNAVGKVLPTYHPTLMLRDETQTRATASYFEHLCFTELDI